MDKDFVKRFRGSAYWHHLGFALTAASPGYAKMIMPVKPELMQRYGQVHGGAIASLVDSCAAAALLAGLDEGDAVTTVELKVNYLNPVSEGTVCAEARVLKQGRSLSVISVEVRDDRETLLAVGLLTYMVIKKEQKN